MVALNPGPHRSLYGGVAAVSTALPIVVGQAVGQGAVGLVASMGALAALYGDHGTARQELAVVSTAAVGVTAGLAVGVATSGHPVLAVVVTALWAVVVTVVGRVLGARQPGILMFVLVCAVGTTLPAAKAGSWILGVAVVSLFATLLTGIAVAIRTVIKHGPVAAPPPTMTAALPNGPWLGVRDLPRELRLLPHSAVPLMAFRVGIAVLVAGGLSLAFQLPMPAWAMTVAAAILTQGTFALSADRRALLTGVGTAVGCLLAGALVLIHPRGVWLALILAVLTYVIELAVVRNFALAMVFITPLAVLLVDAAGPFPNPLTLVWTRLLETLIACVAAVAVGQLVSRGWAVRQRVNAVSAVLVAATDAVATSASPTAAAVLQWARWNLLLVNERTAGERPGIREAVAPLDGVVEDTLQVAAQVLGEAPSGESSEVEAALRRIAGTLDGRSGGTAS